MPDPNVAILTRWFEEVWNQRRVATIHELFAPDAIAHGTDDTGATMRGPQAFLAFYERLIGAFPDIQVKIEDAFSSADKVVLRWSATMTHQGGHLGIPASQKPVALSGVTIARISNGQVVEAWDQWDKLAMLQQIGITAPSHGTATATASA